MLVAAGLMTGCGKDSEETPTKPEDPGDPIPPVTTTVRKEMIINFRHRK